MQQKLWQDSLDWAYVNFFEHRAKYPRFKKKHQQQSIRYPQRFKFNGNRIYLPKVGWVKIASSASSPGRDAQECHRVENQER